jgi:hypothetical protein
VWASFTDYNDSNARFQEVFLFQSPETLHDWLADEHTLRNRTKVLSPFYSAGFRDCQTAAILNLDNPLEIISHAP